MISIRTCEADQGLMSFLFVGSWSSALLILIVCNLVV
jgi:hypothetical protein